MARDSDGLERALDAYTPATDEEGGDLERIRAALKTDDVFSRSSLLHVTASALVVHALSARVLLRWHPKMHRWMQVGGHFDPLETDPLEVARREAREETGLTDLVPLSLRFEVPVQIVIVSVPAHGDEPAHEHADFRYVFGTGQPDAAFAESHAAQLRWVALSTASCIDHGPC